MVSFIKKLFLQLLLSFCFTTLFAQEQWPSPEVEQMNRNAKQYMAAGNFQDAVTTYKQAIKVAPGIITLYRELGNALYLAGKYEEAEQVLTPLLANANVDVQCYIMLAEVEAADQHLKQAIRILNKGLEKFPASGNLYRQTGVVYDLENEHEEALNAWLNGIGKDPAFAPNYFYAANTYLDSKKVIWGIIYGETFLSMVHDTLRDDEIKGKLFKGYKILFDNLVQDDVPKYGESRKQPAVSDFEDAVMKVYAALTPVVSDGITTENLAMVRTRFLMQWGSEYGKKYPSSLFSYQDRVIRSGHFDMYNEWIFGRAESATEYKAWNEFHEGDMRRFLEWKNNNQLAPAINEFYNERDMRGMFGKKKK